MELVIARTRSTAAAVTPATGPDYDEAVPADLVPVDQMRANLLIIDDDAVVAET